MFRRAQPITCETRIHSHILPGFEKETEQRNEYTISQASADCMAHGVSNNKSFELDICIWNKERKRQSYQFHTYQLIWIVFVAGVVVLVIWVGERRSRRWACIYVGRSWCWWITRATDTTNCVLVHHWIACTERSMTGKREKNAEKHKWKEMKSQQQQQNAKIKNKKYSTHNKTFWDIVIHCRIDQLHQVDFIYLLQFFFLHLAVVIIRCSVFLISSVLKLWKTFIRVWLLTKLLAFLQFHFFFSFYRVHKSERNTESVSA